MLCCFSSSISRWNAPRRLHTVLVSSYYWRHYTTPQATAFNRIIMSNPSSMTSPNISSSSGSVVVRRMPAEWELHDVCLMLYPHNVQTFPLQQARDQFWNICHTIANQGQEKVYVFCKDNEQTIQVRQEQQMLLASCSNIEIYTCPSNDTWARDTAPTFVLQQQKAGDDDDDNNATSTIVTTGIDWGFNAYGKGDDVYWPYQADVEIASTMCNVLKKPCISLQDKLILEGGSIHTDGQGTLITTQECLLNPNRNPSLLQNDIETILKETLGCTHIIWLPMGLAYDDDTNGHVDNFCCFCKPGIVILAWTDDNVHDVENYQRCRTALTILESSVDAQGRQLTIHKLYLPSPPLAYTRDETQDLVYRQPGQRLAASYVNFYIANHAIIVPQFGGTATDTDERAIQTLTQIFSSEPHRKVVGVQSREILLGGGNIHCITQQVPSS